MKTWIVSVSMVASSAFSCPDLAGSYVCKGGEGIYEQEIVQFKDDDGKQNYFFFRDGETYGFQVGERVESEQDGLRVSMLGTCSEDADSLLIEIELEGLLEGVPAKGLQSTTLHMASSNTLESHMIFDINFGGVDYQIEAKDTCTKK